MAIDLFCSCVIVIIIVIYKKLTKLQLHVLSTISQSSKKRMNKITVALGMWRAADFVAR